MCDNLDNQRLDNMLQKMVACKIMAICYLQIKGIRRPLRPERVNNITSLHNPTC